LKKILLHICCAPDATACIERLRKEGYQVTGFFYNPSIFPEEEYKKRKEEVIKLARIMEFKVIEGDYNYIKWRKTVKGWEGEKEGGKRCKLCYKERLEVTAKVAKDLGFDFFTTTLTISPHKKSETIFKIEKEISEHYKIPFLEIDFKKREGFKKSIELSRKYNLYRQDYCGCEFSLRDRLRYLSDKKKEFEKIKQEIKSCKKCITIKEHKPVFEGEAFSKIMIIGQAPGIEEHKIQRPFWGPAGRTLWKWFEKIGYSEDFIRKISYITSVIKCYPGKTKIGDRKPSSQEIQNCIENLKREFFYVRPYLLIPVGKVAISLFLGKIKLKEAVGRIYQKRVWNRKVDIVPLPHPSGVNRWLYSSQNMKALNTALNIIKKMIESFS